MAFNLVSLISQFITPDIVASIAEAIGIDRSKAQSAVTAAVPGVLAGLASSAAQPGGAQRIAEAVTENRGIFDSISSIFGGGSQSSLLNMGSQLVTSLFGTRDSRALSDAVSSYAGLGSAQGASLIGMLAPLIMGGIGKALGGSEPSAVGISSLLAGQKNNIMSALPSSVGAMLSGTGLFSAFSGARRTAETAGARAGAWSNDGMRAAASTAYNYGDQNPASTRRDNWLYWVVPLLLLTALALWLLTGTSNRGGLRQASSVSTSIFERENVAGRVAGSLSNLRSTLDTVNDARTARAALPKLRLLNAQLSSIRDRVGEMTPAQRRELAAVITPEMPAVDKAMGDALGSPGVSQELRPTLDEVRLKLNQLSRRQ